MNVFLTHSYFYQLDPKQWNNNTPYPPLGTITALAQIEQINVKTTFYDTALDAGPSLCIKELEKTQPDIVIIYDDGFNYLTKMCLTNMRHACFEIISAAKGIKANVIVCSSDSTDQFKMYHEKGANIVIHGNSELALNECIMHYNGELDLEEIDGISYVKNNEVVAPKSRIKLKELDILPTAKWDAIDVERYRQIWKKGKFPFTLNISTTRGCPFKCNWCAKPLYGNRYNSRSPERVVEEIKHLVGQYNVHHFWITDDIFGLKPGWVKRFDELIQENNLKIKYKIQSRADLLMKDKTIDELASSGLEEVWIGAESGSQKILDAMDKGITIDQINKSTALLQSKNVRVAYFLQFGYLNETKEDIKKTIQMVKSNKPDDIGISVSYPLPGTPFYNKVKEQLAQKANWTDSDDLDLMFEGTYDKEFYRNLQRYVHHLFRWQQGIRKFTSWKKPISWRYVWLAPINLFKAIRLKSGLSL